MKNTLQTLLNENVKNKDNIEWYANSNELDDMAYVLMLNFIYSDDFTNLLKSDNIVEQIELSVPTQENFIQIHLILISQFLFYRQMAVQ
jgi:hypothetical protein